VSEPKPCSIQIRKFGKLPYRYKEPRSKLAYIYRSEAHAQYAIRNLLARKDMDWTNTQVYVVPAIPRKTRTR